MKIVKRVLAVGAAVAAMGALAAPASADRPHVWIISCSTGGTYGANTGIDNAVQACRDAGGHPTKIEPLKD